MRMSCNRAKIYMKLEIINLQKLYPIDKNSIKKIVRSVLKFEKKDAELNIVLTDNKRIKEINKTFLEHNYATDVITFAYDEASLNNDKASYNLDRIASPCNNRGLKGGDQERVTVPPRLNLPPPPFSPSMRGTGGGIQRDTEYSPPLVGGVRGGGALLRERTKKTAGEKMSLPGNTITGEIIISVEMAKKLAQKHDCTVEGEIALYLVHGLLHLFGYNDKQRKEAKKMHQREGKLLSSLGFRVPVPH